MKRTLVNLIGMFLVVLFIATILVSCDTMFGLNDNRDSSDFQSVAESSVQQAFDEFEYDPTVEEISFYVNNYDEDVPIKAIYKSVILPFFSVVPSNSSPQEISENAFIAAVQDMISSSQSSDSEVSFEEIFSDIQNVSIDSKLKPHQACLFVSMLLSFSSDTTTSYTVDELGNFMAKPISGSEKILAGGLMFFGAVATTAIVGVSAPVTLPVATAVWGVSFVSGMIIGSGMEDIENGIEEEIETTLATGYAIYDPITKSVDKVSEQEQTWCFPPRFSLVPGYYTDEQEITVSASPSDATIRYTTDGSTPTATIGFVYSGPVTISKTAQIKAIAYKQGLETSTVRSATYEIPYVGEEGPAGGFIFYDKGSYSDGWRYLEAAPYDQNSGIRWGDTTIVEGGTSTSIGTGEENTSRIVAAGDHYADTLDEGEGEIAADICVDLSLGGYNDWFLPSKDELNQLYVYYANTDEGDFAEGYYWSSSIGGQYKAWGQSFEHGNQWDNAAWNAFYRVRAVRSF